MPFLTGSSDGDGVTRSVVVVIPDDDAFHEALWGAVLELTRPENWQQSGTLTAQEAASAMLQAYDVGDYPP